MRRTIQRAQKPDADSTNLPPSPTESESALITAWWASVLAGDVDEAHPVYGAALRLRLDGARLRLSGELESQQDRDEVVREARKRIGHGIGAVDVSGLKVVVRHEKPGVLQQTLISAFPGRQAAEYARDFVIKHSRVKPKGHHIVDPDDFQNLTGLLPEAFEADARKALDEGLGVLILTVDETDVFRVRELLEEDTRSMWTVAVPPALGAGRRDRR